MMAAFATDKTLVDTAEVQAAIDELGWTEYASNTSNYARINLAMSQTSVVGRITLSYDGNIISSHDLSPGRLLIGRTAQNDLRLDSTYISRHHCQINVTPGSVLIEDLNSTNGLYYKGRKVRRQVLSHNTAINIGRYTLTYLEDTDHTSTHTLSADAPQTISADSTAATETEDPNQAEV
jgi:pSer/pThr/pTyr-binding forkhead associated (FHA) protein